VEAMWLILQRDQPEDYVIATGESHSVRDFVDLAFAHAGIEIEWQGKGLEEKGIIRSSSSHPLPFTPNLKFGDAVIEIDPRYFRPTEVEFLIGDARKARKELGWEPQVKFKDLVKIMVDADLKLLSK
jgi:GDPmannose 4,6-dehydratase